MAKDKEQHPLPDSAAKVIDIDAACCIVSRRQLDRIQVVIVTVPERRVSETLACLTPNLIEESRRPGLQNEKEAVVIVLEAPESDMTTLQKELDEIK